MYIFPHDLNIIFWQEFKQIYIKNTKILINKHCLKIKLILELIEVKLKFFQTLVLVH